MKLCPADAQGEEPPGYSQERGCAKTGQKNVLEAQ